MAAKQGRPQPGPWKEPSWKVLPRAPPASQTSHTLDRWALRNTDARGPPPARDPDPLAWCRPGFLTFPKSPGDAPEQLKPRPPPHLCGSPGWSLGVGGGHAAGEGWDWAQVQGAQPQEATGITTLVLLLPLGTEDRAAEAWGKAFPQTPKSSRPGTQTLISGPRAQRCAPGGGRLCRCPEAQDGWA